MLSSDLMTQLNTDKRICSNFVIILRKMQRKSLPRSMTWTTLHWMVPLVKDFFNFIATDFPFYSMENFFCRRKEILSEKNRKKKRISVDSSNIFEENVFFSGEKIFGFLIKYFLDVRFFSRIFFHPKMFHQATYRRLIFLIANFTNKFSNFSSHSIRLYGEWCWFGNGNNGYHQVARWWSS